MGFLASSASRQPLPVKITKTPLTVPWNSVENSWALRTQRPQVPSPGHLSIREPHLCRAKRVSQVSSRAFRSVDRSGRWTLLAWLPIGGDLESTSMHLGLRICTPVFILICIPPVMESRCFKEEADPSPSPGGGDLPALWPQSLVRVLFSGMVRKFSGACSFGGVRLEELFLYWITRWSLLLAAILWPRGKAEVHRRQRGDLERKALGDSAESLAKLCSNLPRSLWRSQLQEPLSSLKSLVLCYLGTNCA